MSDPGARRIGSRLRGRLTVALFVGPLVGLAVAALVAAVAFESWGGGAIMVLLGGAVAGTLLALLLGGYSSLESPDPGREPSDTQRPVVDRPYLVREENDESLPPSAHGRQHQPDERRVE